MLKPTGQASRGNGVMTISKGKAYDLLSGPGQDLLGGSPKA